MATKLVLTSIFFLTVLFSKAQSVTITGKLQDDETKLAVQGVTVILKSLRDTTSTQTTYTDTAGKFRFVEVARDSFRLSFTSVGYANISRVVRIDSTDRTVKDLGAIVYPKLSKELAGVRL